MSIHNINLQYNQQKNKNTCSHCRSHYHNIKKCNHADKEFMINTFIPNLKYLQDEDCFAYLNTLKSRTLRILAITLGLILNVKREILIINVSVKIKQEKAQDRAARIARMEYLETLLQQKIDENRKELEIWLTLNTVKLETPFQSDCPICIDQFSNEEIYKTNCNHYFCKECISTHIKTNTKESCPICRRKVTEFTMYTTQDIIDEPKKKILL